MDKLADALLGVSPEESNPYNKYALICASCFAHNGLVPKDQFDFVRTFNTFTLALANVGRAKRIIGEYRVPLPSLRTFQS